MINIREIAARIIFQVTEGHSLSELLTESNAKMKQKRDAAFVQAVCYGVCRYYATLDVILSHLLQHPMKAHDSDVHALLLVGLYQLRYMRVPEHAAVAETVNASASLDKAWARGFVNAILREYLRKRETFDEIIKEDEEAHYAHPIWWIQKIKKAWPNDWQAILTANNEHPPFSFRVNQSKMSREDFLKAQAEKKDHVWHEIPNTKEGVVLESPINIEDVPGFLKGVVSVQDGAAQLAAHLLDVKEGMHVLDACAAPGGKLTHILELQPILSDCVAIDNDHARIHLIHENLKRLNQTANVKCADVADINKWWNGKPFDRILLDAPCSASGVLRRHPDIKILREPTDIKMLQQKQWLLLESLWPLLNSGGMLLYVTCSIFPEENVDVMKMFLAQHKDAKEKPFAEEFGVKQEIGQQILPGMNEMDGFYYARVEKV